MIMKYRVLKMSGSSLHLFKNGKYDIQKLRYHLNFSPEWRLDPLVLKNQCLHLFSIETAYEPCSTHIINQTIINLEYTGMV
jgi:hypothetical protein